jgi:hypothetical protein
VRRPGGLHGAGTGDRKGGMGRALIDVFFIRLIVRSARGGGFAINVNSMSCLLGSFRPGRCRLIVASCAMHRAPPAARAPQLRGPGPRPACRKESSLPAERRRLIFLELVSSPMTDEEFRAELYTKGREILERLGSARFGAGLPPIERQDVKQ